MIALFGVEVRRALARALVRVLVGLAVLAIAITGVLVFVNSRAEFDPVATRGEARVAYLRELRECRQFSEPGTPCEQFIQQDDFVEDKRFKGADVADATRGVTPIIVIAAFIAAASFIGAEWKHGTVTTILTWEPRRVRVLGTKLLAALVVAAVITAALYALFVAALVPSVVYRGTTEGSSGWVGDVVRAAANGTFLTLLGVVVGFAVATVGRNTAAALGVGFVYLGPVEGIIRGLKPGWARWLVGDNAGQILVSGAAGEDGPILGGSPGRSATVLTVYAALFAVAALTSFRTRDIT